jgi:hypothetical protein
MFLIIMLNDWNWNEMAFILKHHFSQKVMMTEKIIDQVPNCDYIG